MKKSAQKLEDVLEIQYHFFFLVALRANAGYGLLILEVANAGYGLLILEVSRSHTTTHHSQ